MAALGTGERSRKLKAKLGAGGAYNPAALAAAGKRKGR